MPRYKAGDCTPAFARGYGMAKSALFQLLRKDAVSMRKQPITSADAEQAVRLYQSGLSNAEIPHRIGYSYTTIWKSLHNSSVAKRPKGIKRSSLS